MMINKDIAFKDILKNLRENNLAIFAGAGMSMDSGYVDWRGLIKPIADELGLDVEKESDFVAMAQYHYNAYSSRNKINQVIIENLSNNIYISENHKILARLPIDTFWTTNYDKLIERSLEEAGKKPDVKYTIEQLANTKPKRDAIVYKMHGDVEHPNQAIVIKDDYESYPKTMLPFLTALAGDLISKTFLFIGISFNDPNLDYILSRVRITYNDSQRSHYCFIKKVKRKNNEIDADFEYRERKQNYFIRDLQRYKIQTILIEEYSEITDFLRRLEESYKRNTIFISGAAQEYGKWGKVKSEEFIFELSKKLIQKGFKIVSGFGLGIGSAVIAGALEEIYSNLKTHTKDELILRPFPQGDYKQTNLWYKYRQDMISYAGIAIFVFGNKIENGQMVQSDGMREEFEIAKAQNLLLLPIGSTGYISKKFHEEVCSSFDKFYPGVNKDIKDKFFELSDENKTPEEIINTVIYILDKIK